MYIITSPEEVSAIYKNHEVITWEGFILDMFQRFELTPSKYLKPKRSKDDKSMGSQRLHEKIFSYSIMKKHFTPGPKLDLMTRIQIGYIERQMRWEEVPGPCTIRPVPESKVMSLRSWCAEALGTATVQTIWGHSICDLSSTLLADFHTFEYRSWMLQFSYPNFLARRMNGAIGRLIEAYTRYFENPIEKRADASEYVTSWERRAREEGFSTREMAVRNVMFLWG